jgi:hypothetical protein
MLTCGAFCRCNVCMVLQTKSVSPQLLLLLCLTGITINTVRASFDFGHFEENIGHLWQRFKERYGKKYETTEETTRFFAPICLLAHVITDACCFI